MEFFKPSVTAAGMIGLILASSACYHSLSLAEDLSPPAVQAKLDPRLLQRLRDLEINGQVNEKLNVLVRTVSEINSDQESFLLKKGMRSRTTRSIRSKPMRN